MNTTREASVIAVFMAWEPGLRNPFNRDNLTPRVRPEVASWQEELAEELAASLDVAPWSANQLVVEVEMYFPLGSGEKYAPDTFLGAILFAVEMGTGTDRRQLIPVVSHICYVVEPDSGFLIRVYPACFAGHGLTGRLAHQPGPDGDMIIVLDQGLSPEWDGSRVAINVGVICND